MSGSTAGSDTAGPPPVMDGSREDDIMAVLTTFYSHFDNEEWVRVVGMEKEVLAIAEEMCSNPAWPDNIAAGIYGQLADALGSCQQPERAAAMQAKADAIEVDAPESSAE